ERTLIEDLPVGSRGRDGPGGGDERVVDAVLGDAHADRLRHRRERRGIGQAREHGARGEENDEDARDESVSHDALRYTSGLSTPMNGRLRYFSAKSSP